MIPGLKKLDPVVMHFIDDSMLFIETTRPGTRSFVFQRLRFTYTRKGFSHRRLDEV